MKTDNGQKLSITDLAHELGLSGRWTRELAQRGMPRTSVLDARAWLKQQSATAGDDESGLTVRKLAAEVRCIEARSEVLELKARQARGELVPLDDIRRDTAVLLADFKCRLLDIPDQAVIECPHEFRSGVRASVRHAVETALRDLARGLTRVASPDTETSADA